MKKILRKWGNSIVLSFTAEECNVRDLKAGSEVEVDLKGTGRLFEEDTKKSLLGLISENKSKEDSSEFVETKPEVADLVKSAMQTAAGLMAPLLQVQDQVKEYEIINPEKASEEPRKTLFSDHPQLKENKHILNPEGSESKPEAKEEVFDIQSLIDEAPDEPSLANLSEEKDDEPGESKEVFKKGENGEWKTS